MLWAIVCQPSQGPVQLHRTDTQISHCLWPNENKRKIKINEKLKKENVKSVITDYVQSNVTQSETTHFYVCLFIYYLFIFIF